MTIPWAGRYNLIDLLGGLGGSLMAYLAYGTGTTAVANGDTTLETEQDREEADLERVSVFGPLDTYRFSVLFDMASAHVVSEVGLFSAAAGGTMMIRNVLTKTVTGIVDGKVLVVLDVTIMDGGFTATGC